MNNSIVSIIVPIYNVEQYLDRCMKSIINQTYHNLEIIMIDDGSTDSCFEKCNEWAKIDSRIKVIHNENGGLSSARNTGLKIANGEFIVFVDSDDYLNVNMVKLLLNAILSSNSDISCGSIELVWEDSPKREFLIKNKKMILSNLDSMESIITEKFLKQPVVYKMYRANIIKDILFDVGKINEDDFWSYQVIAKANQVILIPETVYYYVQRNGSIMNEKFSLKRLDVLDAKIERNKFLAEKYPIFVSIGNDDLYGACRYAMQMSLKYLNSNDKKYAIKKIEKILDNIPKQSIGYYTKSEKIWFVLYKINFVAMCKIRNFLKIGF